jgi:hypothetical protein
VLFLHPALVIQHGLALEGAFHDIGDVAAFIVSGRLESGICSHTRLNVYKSLKDSLSHASV